MKISGGGIILGYLAFLNFIAFLMVFYPDKLIFMRNKPDNLRKPFGRFFFIICIFIDLAAAYLIASGQLSFK